MRLLARLLAFAFVASALQVPASASAQTWPAKPIKLVVGFAPGGVADVTARVVAQKLAEQLGQQVVVDNRPSAGGIVAAEAVAKSVPDGYTLLLMSNGNAVSASLFKSLPFDTLADFAPVSTLGFFDVAVVAGADAKIDSMNALMAYAKANPGKLNIGTINVGSTQHLSAELFRSMANIDVTHVPYRGGAPALADLVSGQLSFMIENMPGTLPLVKSGKLKALGVTTDHRAALAPEIPTIAESGLPGYEVVGWNGLFVVKDTPPAIAGRIYDEVAKALRSADVKTQMAALGAEPGGNTPAEFTAFVRAESARWGRIIQDKGIRPE